MSEEFEMEEFRAWSEHALDYFLEVLNGEKTIETAREDLLSFRNSKYYTGTRDIFRTINEDE